jgi:membrane fusion protein (multidrug efflux system)
MTEPDSPAGAAPAAPPPARPVPSPKRASAWPRWALALAVIGVIVAIVFVVLLAPYFQARTDDAYVEGDVVTVAPKVPGYVVQLDVDDNSRFKAGERLLQIDERDYRNAVAAAEGDLANAQAARAEIAALLAQQTHVIAAARAALPGDRAQLTFARQQVDRYRTLQGGYGSVEHLQQTQADSGQRDSTLEKDTAEANVAETEVNVLRTKLKEADAEVARRSAALAQARLNLAYTRISANFDGTVANRIVRAGDYVQPGQALLSEVPLRVYVIANYKETQVGRMRVGQRVSIHVDALPGQTFRGHIDSFQRGTGSRFALLPPENATGNFVKVVQRVPVKILFDAPTEQLRRVAPGMSVETDVSSEADAPARAGGA